MKANLVQRVYVPYGVPPRAPTSALLGAFCAAACLLGACDRPASRHTEASAVDKRHIVLHLPRMEAPLTGYPLVIALHGGFGSGAQLERAVGLDAIADREGFAVVYPDGRAHHWNDGRGPDAGGEDVDDVAYVRSLIDDLAAKHPIDTRRIYAVGLSNGAMMAYRLACELSDTLAAVATVAGGIATNVAPRCHPSRAISVLAIHGTADPIMPFDGGDVNGGRAGRPRQPRGKVLGARASIEIFSAAARCTPTPSRTARTKLVPSDPTSVTEVVYADCAPGTGIELVEIDGGGHTWPGATSWLPASFVGPTSQQLQTSELIWQFLARHVTTR